MKIIFQSPENPHPSPTINSRREDGGSEVVAPKIGQKEATEWKSLKNTGVR